MFLYLGTLTLRVFLGTSSSDLHTHVVPKSSLWIQIHSSTHRERVDAGLRTEEVCALQWDDVNLEEDIITVRHVITVTEKHEYSDVRNTKSKKMRKLPIPPELHAILASSERVKDNPYVIPYQGGKRTYPYEYLFYTPNVYFERYEKFMKSLPIRYLSPHKLRHTYGTYLTRSGADLPSIQKLMGHSSVNTTRISTFLVMSISHFHMVL